jgi:uncharacterized protein
MELSDTRQIKADVAHVWAAILNPDVLQACIPGCTSMTGSITEGYTAVVVQKIGPVSATFTGVVTLSDIVEGKSLRISGEGKGGAAGHAKGGADVTLEETAEGTTLTYQVKANVGGKIAQLGSRLIDGFAKKLADDFFTRFQDAVEGPDEEVVAADDAGEKKKGWFRRMIGV